MHLCMASINRTFKDGCYASVECGTCNIPCNKSLHKGNSQRYSQMLTGLPPKPWHILLSPVFPYPLFVVLLLTFQHGHFTSRTKIQHKHSICTWAWSPPPPNSIKSSLVHLKKYEPHLIQPNNLTQRLFPINSTSATHTLYIHTHVCVCLYSTPCHYLGEGVGELHWFLPLLPPHQHWRVASQLQHHDLDKERDTSKANNAVNKPGSTKGVGIIIHCCNVL